MDRHLQRRDSSGRQSYRLTSSSLLARISCLYPWTWDYMGVKTVFALFWHFSRLRWGRWKRSPRFRRFRFTFGGAGFDRFCHHCPCSNLLRKSCRSFPLSWRVRVLQARSMERGRLCPWMGLNQEGHICQMVGSYSANAQVGWYVIVNRPDLSGLVGLTYTMLLRGFQIAGSWTDLLLSLATKDALSGRAYQRSYWHSSNFIL